MFYGAGGPLFFMVISASILSAGCLLSGSGAAEKKKQAGELRNDVCGLTGLNPREH